MFLLVFMWTPPHFWALALFMKSDYHEAKVHMLTVTHGRRATRAHILVYTIALLPVALATGLTSIGGPVYLAAALWFSLGFLHGAWAIWKRDEVQAEADSYATEKRVFRFSLSYLFVLFGALIAEAALRNLPAYAEFVAQFNLMEML